MAKKNLGEIIKKIENNIGLIKARLTSSENMEAIGKMTAEGIYKRTKAGSGVSAWGGEKEPLAPLQPSYVSQRRRGKISAYLDSTTRPAKSNLTLTGAMLSDLAYKILKNKITIYFMSDFSAQKAEWARKGDASRNREPRPFMLLSYTEIKRVKDFARKKVLEIIDAIFK